MDVLAIARLFLFVREAGPNSGQRVNAIQVWGGGTVGQSWCCYFATMVLDLAFQGTAPVPRLGACQAVYELAQQKGWLTDAPAPGDLFLRVADGHAHHIGFVTRHDGATVGTISGNTSADGKSSNGDRVAERDLTPAAGTMVYVAYPRS